MRFSNVSMSRGEIQFPLEAARSAGGEVHGFPYTDLSYCLDLAKPGDWIWADDGRGMHFSARLDADGRFWTVTRPCPVSDPEWALLNTVRDGDSLVFWNGPHAMHFVAANDAGRQHRDQSLGYVTLVLVDDTPRQGRPYRSVMGEISQGFTWDTDSAWIIRDREDDTGG